MPRMIYQGWAMQEPVAVELATSSTESPAVGTSSRWVLEMEAVEGMTWPCRGEIHEVMLGRYHIVLHSVQIIFI